MGKSDPSKQASEQSTLPTHGAQTLPAVEVDSYSVELEDEEGFAGDKANKGAFLRILEEIRKPLRALGEDPFGSKPSAQLSRKKLGALLAKGDPGAAAVVQSAVEDFAQQLQKVIRRFLKLKAWRDTECIVVGGGFRASRVGELAIARAGIILKTEGVQTDIQLIHNDPDEAALIGTAYLLPAWMVEGYDAILAVDVGGTNIRAGIVELNISKGKDLSKACVLDMEHWCHQEEDGIKRNSAVDRLVQMLTALANAAKKRSLRLAPMIGIGCPGVIRRDGSIERGAQNLPGNWEGEKFNLPQVIRERLPQIGDHETLVVMHNDAVVQGLGEIPYMVDREHWGILTIGTGLGNARFSARPKVKSQ
jgi:predicted NBD/HSP70 family sugar kinase